MNWKKLLLSGFSVLTAVSLGFFLPDLVGNIRRDALLRATEQISSETVALHFVTMDFHEKLAAAATGDAEIVMDIGTQLSSDEAVCCAQQILAYLYDGGYADLDPYNSELHFTAQAYYTLSYETLKSLIQWQIAVADSAGEWVCSLWLDDETAVLLAVSHLPLRIADMPLSLPEIALAWGMFYAEYNGLEFIAGYPADQQTAQTEGEWTEFSGSLAWDLEFLLDEQILRLGFLYRNGYCDFNI